MMYKGSAKAIDMLVKFNTILIAIGVVIIVTLIAMPKKRPVFHPEEAHREFNYDYEAFKTKDSLNKLYIRKLDSVILMLNIKDSIHLVKLQAINKRQISIQNEYKALLHSKPLTGDSLYRAISAFRNYPMPSR